MASPDSKIEDLLESLKIDNVEWNAWEIDFIESLDGRTFSSLSVKQKSKVEELWDDL